MSESVNERVIVRHAAMLVAVASLLIPLRALGQTVQLPTLRSFSVGTTVVVPDRGSAYLGGVSRARYGSASAGTPCLDHLPGVSRLFANRASGAELSSMGASVSATIIDLRAMDAAVLAAAAADRRRPDIDPHRDQRAMFIARNIDRNGPPPQAEAKPQPDPQSTAKACYDLALRAEAEGRRGAAKCQYQRVLQLDNGELGAWARSRLDAIRAAESKPLKDARSADSMVPKIEVR